VTAPTKAFESATVDEVHAWDEDPGRSRLEIRRRFGIGAFAAVTHERFRAFARDDSDFASIEDDPRFREIVGSA
jgi:hypothetical protein